MKIYTKTGDKGQTSLIGGKRIAKHHIRIESYGTVDELLAFTGLLRDQNIAPAVKQQLLQIQDDLMHLSAILASDCNTCGHRVPLPDPQATARLESQIDTMDTALPPLAAFVIPGGHPAVSLCHVARTVCRRAERHVAQLAETEPVHPEVVQYLNRLSDYFFTLSRSLSVYFKVVEHIWEPKL